MGSVSMMTTAHSEICYEILNNLSEDLRRPKWRFNKNWLAGHCYVASEVAYHLTGGRLVWKPMVVRHEGGTHWYLQNRFDGDVLDLTASQFYTKIPYHKGRGCGFLTKGPSKRARKLIERINAI